MKYAIGQILYVVLSKRNQVYPMQVTEVITKKTLKGEDVSYVLQAGTGDSTVMLHQIDGEVFDSADTARKTLVQRATQQVHKLVDVAVKKAAEWYKDPTPAPQVQTIQGLPDLAGPTSYEEDDDASSVILPDGTVAKVNLSSI